MWTAAPLVDWQGEAVALTGFNGATLRLDGRPALRLAVGPDAGPPLLLLPGLGDPWSSFVPVLPTLAERFRVVVLDYRGHGPSGRATGRAYRVSDHLGDVVAVVRVMGAEAPVVVAGNSLGALLAAGVAAALPERVAAVVLEDGPFFVVEGERWRDSAIRRLGFSRVAGLLRLVERGRIDRSAFVERHRQRPWAFHPGGPYPDRLRHVAGVMTLLAADWPRLDATAQARLRAGHLRFLAGAAARWADMLPVEAIDAVAARWLAVDPDCVGVAATQGFSAGFVHDAVLAGVRSPALVLEADRDLSGLLTAAEMERLLRGLGGVVEHQRIAGAPHIIHAAAPARWLDAVSGFLSRIGR